MKAVGKPIQNRAITKTRTVTSHDPLKKGEWQSEEDLYVLLANITDAIFKSRGGIIVWCNESVRDVFGYTADELLGTDGTLLFPDTRDHIAMKETAYRLTAEHGYLRGTTQVKKKDGSIAFVQFSISRVAGKSPPEFVTVASDITKHALAESALSESEDRYRLLAHNVTDVIWTMDMNLQYTYVSPSIQHQRGYSPEEFVALTARKLSPTTPLKKRSGFW